jgi:hypothetical protein
MLKSSQPQLLPFTDFGSVTPATRLADLNLNWREQDLPEQQRTKHVHRLHPYLGKFIPQLVEIFLRKYTPSLVVDPFCGSGTTLVETQAFGVASFGCDISEFNCLLSKVKTDHYDLDLVEDEINDALSRSRREGQGRLLETEGLYVTSSYLTERFAPRALEELLNFRATIEGYHYKDVLKVILSRAARPARLTTHFDLDFPKQPQTEPYSCYKHSRICRPTTSAKQFIKRYSLDTVKRIREFATIQSGAKVQVLCGDPRNVEFPECDLVLTSPPYIGLIDYHEQHRYAYELLGLNWNASKEIGPASVGNSVAAQKTYLDQIEQVFANLKQHLKKNTRLVVVVHDRKNLYQELSKRLGFRTEAELHRHVNRRTGRRAGDFF